MSRGFHVLVAGLLLVLPACSPSAGGVEPDNRRVTVEVRSQYALPVDIYVVGGGSFHRLGVVNPGMDGTFYIPQNLARNGSVRLEARPAGTAQPFRSGDLLLAPGSVVDLLVAQQLFSSTATLRP